MMGAPCNTLFMRCLEYLAGSFRHFGPFLSIPGEIMSFGVSPVNYSDSDSDSDSERPDPKDGAPYHVIPANDTKGSKNVCTNQTNHMTG